MNTINLSRLDRIRLTFRENRLMTSIELFIVSAIGALELVDFPSVLFLFPMGIGLDLMGN